MDHVAIMRKSWGLIDRILAGEKTIESRWYRTRRAPWNAILTGETIYFKDAGEPVTAVARVTEVLQFEIETVEDARAIVADYGRQICVVNPDPHTWGPLPRYSILMRLSDPRRVSEPFHINRDGFGSGAAWISVNDIVTIKAPTSSAAAGATQPGN